jgi:beta-glucosidase-like glycosyl hydrolase
VKHFPGHGDTIFDSQNTLPILPHGVSRLEEFELRPFQAAITERCAGMMLGHISFAALDPEHPASLSRAIVFGLLRQKLKYRGFLMIDDIDMGALTRESSREQVATAGVASGADCFLCARIPSSAYEVIDAIERGVQAGTILPERIETARRRIGSLIHRYQQDPGEAPDLSVVGKQPTLENLDSAVLPIPSQRIPKIS